MANGISRFFQALRGRGAAQMPQPGTVGTLFGRLPTFEALQAQEAQLTPEQREARFQETVSKVGSNVVGLGVTGKLSQTALRKLAAEAEEITLQGGAKPLGKLGTDTQLFPSTILKQATNPLRADPERMMQLTQQIQKEGVKSGQVLMWKMPDGSLRLIEGHHTSTIANALDPTKKIPVKIIDAPAGQTIVK